MDDKNARDCNDYMWNSVPLQLLNNQVFCSFHRRWQNPMHQHRAYILATTIHHLVLQRVSTAPKPMVHAAHGVVVISLILERSLKRFGDCKNSSTEADHIWC